MFGLFKKDISSLELCVLFIKVVTPIVENKKEELLNLDLIEESVLRYANDSNKKISNEQLVTIGYASQILSMGEDLQTKIIELNNSSIEETKDKFIDIWDEFKNFGCFVDI
jgi:hypothetical protein